MRTPITNTNAPTYDPDKPRRARTDIRLGDDLSEKVEEGCSMLGATKNSFFVFAAADFCLRLSKLNTTNSGRVELMRAAATSFVEEFNNHSEDLGIRMRITIDE